MQPASLNLLPSSQPSFLLSNRPHKAPKKLLSIITKDHTLTSGLKSDPHTPLSSQLHKSMTPGLATSIIISKKSEQINVNNLSLYRLPIPADLVNIQNTHSERLTTVRMFKKRREMTRIEDDPSPLFKKEISSATIQQIKRGQELGSVKMLVDHGWKVFSRQKKEKVKQKGSMFVTDLWSQDYERNVIKATKLDKDLNQENKVDKRPLDLKLKELVSFYQRKSSRKMISHENLEDMSAKTPKQGRFELKKVALLEAEGDVLVEDRTSSLENTAKRDLNLMTDISTLEKSPIAKVIFEESSDLKKQFKGIEAMFNVSITERKKSKFVCQEDTETFGEVRHKTEQDNDDTTKATGKHKHSSFMSKYLFSTRSMSFKSDEKLSDTGIKKKGKECDISRKTSKDEAPPIKGSVRGQTMRVSIGKRGNTLEENRKEFKKQSSAVLGDLIGICKTEMDEKEMCLNKLDKLKTVFDKKRVVRKNIAKVKMQETIGNLKYMVELKKTKNSKVPNP